MVGCRNGSHAADQGQPAPGLDAGPQSSSASVASDLRVEARSVRLLGVGWASVVDVTLDGDLHGPASLWVPAGGSEMDAFLMQAGSPAGAKIELRLVPLTPPDAGLGGPYTLHVEEVFDGGGIVYWRVTSFEIRAAAP